jgi:hypothetical protein
LGLFGQAKVDEFRQNVELIPFSECHYWNGRADKLGYGRIQVNGKPMLAHRFSYALEHGECPATLKVRHRCDNPNCVNPAHLEIGTQADNIADMVARDRTASGEKHPSAKLTDAQVMELLSLANAGVQTGVLAERFGISKSHVSSLRHGRVRKTSPTYASVTGHRS